MFDIKNKSHSPVLISARTLMLTIGVLGFVLPILLILVAVTLDDCVVVQGSISAYYYTVSRNVFVGGISAIALCLYAYKGYSNVDDWAGNLACLFALGVAFFPTSFSGPTTQCINQTIENGLIGTFHFISAGLLFLVLSFFSLILFTKGPETPRKIIENRIYRCCGIVMLGCLVMIAVYSFFIVKSYPQLQSYSPVFWLETLLLWSFSISWLTKSKVMYPNVRD